MSDFVSDKKSERYVGSVMSRTFFFSLGDISSDTKNGDNVGDKASVNSALVVFTLHDSNRRYIHKMDIKLHYKIISKYHYADTLLDRHRFYMIFHLTCTVSKAQRYIGVNVWIFDVWPVVNVFRCNWRRNFVSTFTVANLLHRYRWVEKCDNSVCLAIQRWPLIWQTDRQTELLQQVHRYAVLTPLRAANEKTRMLAVNECWGILSSYNTTCCCDKWTRRLPDYCTQVAMKQQSAWCI